MKSTIYALLFFSSMFLFTCTFDKIVEVDTCNLAGANYDTNVKQIIDESCAITGCHIAGGNGPGDYSSYEGMKDALNASGFENYVITLKDDPDSGMPPNWDDNPGPKDLTESQFEIVKCWVTNGYPEN